MKIGCDHPEVANGVPEVANGVPEVANGVPEVVSGVPEVASVETVLGSAVIAVAVARGTEAKADFCFAAELIAEHW